MKRVVVTGIGALTPLGNSFGTSWETAKNGISGIAGITRFDAALLPWKEAGELKGFDAQGYFSAKEIRRLDLFVHYAVAASRMAVEDAGLLEGEGNRKQISIGRSSRASWAVVIGSSRGGISTIERALTETKTARLHSRTPRLSPFLMPATTICMAASYVAQKLGIGGHCLGISNACASGSGAIGEAFRLIRAGISSVAIAGGTEAPLCRICVEGYGAARALSMQGNPSGGGHKVPRPFDRNRDGFVLSEGACILVLEEYDHAVKRGASIYGEISGYGNCTDSFHMTQPDPGGEAKAIRLALKEARAEPGDVDYINAHGTGTLLGDRAEAEAIRKAFGKEGAKIPVSALKSLTGHMLAASGAFEVACTLMSLKEGIIPPTINLAERDPHCDINVVTKKTKADLQIGLSDSFGFGGVNAVIVLKRMQ